MSSNGVLHLCSTKTFLLLMVTYSVLLVFSQSCQLLLFSFLNCYLFLRAIILVNFAWILLIHSRKNVFLSSKVVVMECSFVKQVSSKYWFHKVNIQSRWYLVSLSTALILLRTCEKYRIKKETYICMYYVCLLIRITYCQYFFV